MDQNESFLSDRMVFSNFPNLTDINTKTQKSYVYNKSSMKIINSSYRPENKWHTLEGVHCLYLYLDPSLSQ